VLCKKSLNAANFIYQTKTTLYCYQITVHYSYTYTIILFVCTNFVIFDIILLLFFVIHKLFVWITKNIQRQGIQTKCLTIHNNTTAV